MADRDDAVEVDALVLRHLDGTLVVVPEVVLRSFAVLPHARDATEHRLRDGDPARWRAEVNLPVSWRPPRAGGLYSRGTEITYGPWPTGIHVPPPWKHGPHHEPPQPGIHEPPPPGINEPPPPPGINEPPPGPSGEGPPPAGINEPPPPGINQPPPPSPGGGRPGA